MGSRRGCWERRLPLADPWLVGWLVVRACVRACARACVFCVCCVSCVFSVCFLCALSVVCACVVFCVFVLLCCCVLVWCVLWFAVRCVCRVCCGVVVLVVLAAIIRVRAVENNLPSVVEPGNGEKIDIMRLFEGWTTTSALDCGDDRSARSPIDAVLAAIGSEMLGVGAAPTAM